MHFLSRGTSFLRRAYQAENPFCNREAHLIQYSSPLMAFVVVRTFIFVVPFFAPHYIYWAIKQLEAIYLDVMRLGGGYIKYSS